MLTGTASRDSAALGVDLGAAVRARLAGFPGFLRANGFGVGGTDAVSALETGARVGILDPQVLRWSLKALLCGRSDEWRRFDRLFDAYFLPPNREPVCARRRPAGRTRGADAGGADADSDASPGGRPRGGRRPGCGFPAGTAPVAKNPWPPPIFTSSTGPKTSTLIEALMRRFARRLRPLRLRREATHHHGRRLDLQATIRRSVASGGTPIRLAWKERRRVRPRLVLLVDVSRSMSPYSFFYMRLARALLGEVADVHCFIFHTRITDVGAALSDPDPWRSQERLHVLAIGWAGGTRIGDCLREFNRDSGARLVHSRTGVIIVSDGYDTGEPEGLADALATLRRRSRRLVWLNPLLGRPGFSPESRGMRAAMPHIDLLAAGADLESVERVVPQVLQALR